MNMRTVSEANCRAGRTNQHLAIVLMAGSNVIKTVIELSHS